MSACHSRDDRTRTAFEQYQAASAQGDLQGARRALLALVAADDTVADYWIELGKIQVQLGDLGAAFNAFQRAHELNRADPAVLGYLTQIALRAGSLDQAEQTARELELVAPSDPAVPLTYGYVALRRGDLDEAEKQAGVLLATNAFDPSGKILRARVLLQAGKPDEAIALLRDQVRAQPSDQLSLRALLGIFAYRRQWPEVAETARNLLNWQPKELTLRAQLIEAELHAGQPQLAIPDTVRGLAQAGALDVRPLLAPWLASKQAALVTPAAVAAAESADPAKRTAIADFLLRSGQPRLVMNLLKGMATLPVNTANINANALFGTAQGQTGDLPEGLQRLDAALTIDNANAAALRGRAQLRSLSAQHKGAIEDAQKFVAADRSSPEARLLLAHIYASAGQSDAARRTLWDAFHEIPADRAIFEALQQFVFRTDGPAAAQALTEEYNDQRTDEMIRGFA